MRFYSDVLNKPFDTEEELRAAEAKENEKLELAKVAKEKRAAAAKEVEKLFKEANDKSEEAYKALNDFVKEYGSFHATFDGNTVSTRGLLNSFFKDWFFGC